MKHFVKDLGIALEESREMGLALPGLALVIIVFFLNHLLILTFIMGIFTKAQQLYVSLMAHNEKDLGIQALLLALERMNNTSLVENLSQDK